MGENELLHTLCKKATMRNKEQTLKYPWIKSMCTEDDSGCYK